MIFPNSTKLNSSVRPQDGTLTGITQLQVKVDLRVMVMKWVLHIPEISRLGPHNQMQFNVIPGEKISIGKKKEKYKINLLQVSAFQYTYSDMLCSIVQPLESAI